MPLYTYRCRNKEKHEVEEQRPMAERHRATYCARCKTIYGETIEMDLVIGLVAPTFPGAASWRGG